MYKLIGVVLLDKILDKLLGDAPTEIIFLLVGSSLLYILQQIYKKLQKNLSQNRLKRELTILKRKQKDIKVIDLANGDPDFANENIFVRTVNLFGKSKSLYIDLHSTHKEKLTLIESKKGFIHKQKSIFHKDESFDGSSCFKDLENITGIKNLRSLIEKHRLIVGSKFIEAKEGMLFNSKKFGIYNLSFTRFGEQEKPGAEIDLFETDYFTHRVFRSIFHDLKDQNHEIINVNAQNFLKYKPFFTSFGINTVLITEGDKGKEIILSKRSTKVNTKESMYHITMNEGLSITDKDPFDKVDLELCFKRGLLEELGITEKLYALSVRGSFYDFFLEFNNFEIGLSSVLEMEINFEKDIKPLVARDKALESSHFISIPLKQKEIQKFVKNNKFIPHGLYVLERILLRENVHI
jgi:hypothetical protein